MKPLSCLEMNAGIIRSWLDDRLDADSSVKVKQHLRECSSCFSSLMGTMSHNLFTFLKDGDTAQVSSFREQVSHLLSQEPPLPDTSDKPIPAFSPDEFLILELLAGNQSRYGLELVEKSESRLKHDKIYVTLERMQEKEEQHRIKMKKNNKLYHVAKRKLRPFINSILLVKQRRAWCQVVSVGITPPFIDWIHRDASLLK